MSAALRFARLLGSRVSQTTPASSALLSAKPKLVAQQPAASIVSVAHQDESFPKRPTPFDYKNKRYSWLLYKLPFLDKTDLRINPNSKIIVVEGNMGSGKEKVAKELAERFDWYYMPEPTMDDYFINHNGFDYRTLNKYLPEMVQAVDDKIFYENPKHTGVTWFKRNYYFIRYAQYIDALAHLFNTGQGVVLERSPQSDMVFTEAMHKTGILPRDFYDYYYRLRYDTIHQLLRPHLLIYLDTDPELAFKKIKERNIPYQVNSPAMTLEYLTEIRNAYMQKYLPDAALYSELLLYKWDAPHDDVMDEMVDEIEKLEMDDWDTKGLKFKDWNFYWSEHYHNARWEYTNNKMDMLGDFWRTPFYDVDSYWQDMNDLEHREEVYFSFVPNYGVEPGLDSNRVGIFKSLFGRWHFRSFEDSKLRAPYF